MPEITGNVKFDNIAREWRCKWSADNDKASLTAVQEQLSSVLGDLSSVDGVASVQRVVCGGCLDFKVVTKLPADKFAQWETAGFAPEAAFLSAVKGIAGITAVETQTYTLEDVKMNAKDIKKYKADKEKKAAEQPAQEEKAPEDPAKVLKKVWKEGGKRGVEIEGAADMGGLQFFCTAVEEPQGDLELTKKSMEAMNQESDPAEEERKGGSGHIGKMIFSAGSERLSICAYVPKEKQENCNCKEWLEKVLSLYPSGKLDSSSDDVCCGFIPTDSDKNIFPLKIRETLILEANNFLRKKGLFPEDDGSDDEMVFGDDDFPS